MVNNFYVSSYAFSGKKISEIINIAGINNFNIEFSSGIPFENNLLDKMYESNINKIIHNYFPAPSVPFVLNLASQNDIIRNQSISHCLKGIDISKKIGAPFFSAHAGFCIDPLPAELGKKISIKNNINRVANFEIFIESLKTIINYAAEKDIVFLIENNVIAEFNLKTRSVNPFLCTDSKEINNVFDKIQSNYLGLLCDTAHLKVSCKTLNLNLEQEINNLLKLMNCVHHSDNNGLIDSNQSIDESYWFLPFMYKLHNIVHVLEVKDINPEQIIHQISLLERNGG